MSGAWLDQCLEEWQFVPEEPYKLTAHLQQESPAAPADMGEEEEEPPASKAAAVQPPTAQRLGHAQGHPQQRLSQKTASMADASIPDTLENLCSLQPSDVRRSPPPAAAAAAPATGAEPAVTSPAPPTQPQVEQQGAALSNGAAAAAAQQHAAGDAAAAADDAGAGATTDDVDAMSQDLTADPTQEPEDVEADAAGGEAEVRVALMCWLDRERLPCPCSSSDSSSTAIVLTQGITPSTPPASHFSCLHVSNSAQLCLHL